MFAALAQSENDYYGRQLPNLLLSPDTKTTLNQSNVNRYRDAVKVYDPYTKKNETNKGDWASYITGLDISQDLRDQASFCASATSPGDLAGLVNYKDRVRCGWIIKKGPSGSPAPLVSEGALGTDKGPLSFFPHGDGNWFWNLMDAQKVLDSTRCSALTSCSDVANSDYYGKCAFCTSLGKGVPIKSDGTLKYPNDTRSACATKNLVTAVASCPPPPAPGSPAAAAAALDICAMNASGQISRNCILNRLLQAGCSDQGSVSVALQTGATPSDYAASLQNVPAFQKYQTFATTPLNADILSQGAGSATMALNGFQQLASDANTKDITTAIGAAARDLCLKKGVYDTYDFCSELTDSSRSPFPLECLQKLFKRSGGQATGTLYPIDTSSPTNPVGEELASVNSQLKYLYGLGLGPGSGNTTFNNLYAQQQTLTAQLSAGNTFQYWNKNYNTWGDVKAAMRDLAAATKSTDQGEQSAALTQFLGIKRAAGDLPQIAAKNGFEIFFFPGTTNNNTFLGRRVLGSGDFPSMGPNYGGPKFQTGFTQMQFAIITNLRPDQTETNLSFQVDTSDGTALSVNTDIDPIRTTANDSTYFSRFFDQTSTHYENVCTTLVAGGPNYLTIRYYDNHGNASFKIQTRNCSSGEKKPIPPYMFSLTQEPAAPFASFSVLYRDDVAYFEEMRLGRDLFSAILVGSGGGGKVLSGQPLKGGLIPYRIGGGSGWQVKTRIAFQSLRTITLAWALDGTSVGTGATSAPLFSWADPTTGNGLTLVLAGQQLIASWTIQGSAPITGTLPVNIHGVGTTNYTRITFEAIGGVLLPNQIRIATIAMDLNDLTNIEQSANQILLVAPNILFTRYIQNQSMAGYITVGTPQGSAATGSGGVGILLAFLHIFDYIVDTTKAQTDITNSWQRQFIYST